MICLSNLNSGENFYLANQLNLGELSYLGGGQAKLLKTNQIVQISLHAVVGRVVEGEIVKEKLLTNEN